MSLTKINDKNYFWKSCVLTASSLSAHSRPDTTFINILIWGGILKNTKFKYEENMRELLNFD